MRALKESKWLAVHAMRVTLGVLLQLAAAATTDHPVCAPPPGRDRLSCINSGLSRTFL